MIELQWSGILANLGTKVGERLSKHITTTEDTFRYLFFLELLAVGITTEQMILERPHPHVTLRGKEIDLTVLSQGEVCDFEVKYHRPIPSGHNLPMTQLRGAAITDFYKLALSDGRWRFFLYGATGAMKSHWEKNMGPLLSAGRELPFEMGKLWLASQPKTLTSQIESKLGFLPTDLSMCAWLEASWSSTKQAIWLFGMQ